MSERIIEVAAGVLVDDAGRVLLCQRGYGAQQGLWEFPGGKREAGESFAACLEREIGEELGMRVTCERELLRMKYYEELDDAEIGRILGLGRDSVRPCLTRARRRLRAVLKEVDSHAQ